MLKLANENQPLPKFPLQISVHARIDAKRSEVESINVAGRWEGSDPTLKNEFVLLSAHLDHLGVGPPIDGDRIYNGAMDNDHAPSDDLNQPVDKTAAAQFNRLLLALIERVANEPRRPHWNVDSFFRRFTTGN